ncbi:hypothetical protein ACPOL_5198 [Acidisarcina polymorpha]|uniref:Uncharacterized protein n=1 Tax=Acidisarcina polymorpha TaxID=2211140 RepID=A0A2Z5G5H6_9BACT|nr:hypothetical protein ACPOL_5198 [Acidisarcina polymorpha]
MREFPSASPAAILFSSRDPPVVDHQNTVGESKSPNPCQSLGLTSSVQMPAQSR